MIQLSSNIYQLGQSKPSIEINVISRYAYYRDRELFEMFSRSGPIGTAPLKTLSYIICFVVRYCLAPSGTVAVVQFMESEHAKKAFKRLAYSRFK